MDKASGVTATFLVISHLPTAYFALVMATGIVSIASYYLEFSLGELLFYFNIAAYLFLCLLYIRSIIYQQIVPPI